MLGDQVSQIKVYYCLAQSTLKNMPPYIIVYNVTIKSCC